MPEGPKKLFWETSPPLYVRVWMTSAPHPSQSLDPALLYIYTKISSFTPVSYMRICFDNLAVHFLFREADNVYLKFAVDAILNLANDQRHHEMETIPHAVHHPLSKGRETHHSWSLRIENALEFFSVRQFSLRFNHILQTKYLKWGAFIFISTSD